MANIKIGLDEFVKDNGLDAFVMLEVGSGRGFQNIRAPSYFKDFSNADCISVGVDVDHEMVERANTLLFDNGAKGYDNKVLFVYMLFLQVCVHLFDASPPSFSARVRWKDVIRWCPFCILVFGRW